MISLKQILKDLLKENYQYTSDEKRHNYIKKALKQKPSQQQPNYDKLVDNYDDIFWNPYEDLTFVRNRGDYIEYYEGFVEACWDALYEKPEYKGLSEDEAIQKLVKERFSKIAKNLNLEIGFYDFRDDVLNIQFDKIKGDIK